MTRPAILVLLAALAVSCSAVQSEPRRGRRDTGDGSTYAAIGGRVGVALAEVPAGATDVDIDGIAAGGVLEVGWAWPGVPLEFGARGAVTYYDGESDDVLPEIAAEARQLAGLALVRLIPPPSSAFRPFAEVGIGAHATNVELEAAPLGRLLDDTDTGLILTAGAGIGFAVAETAEVRISASFEHTELPDADLQAVVGQVLVVSRF